MNDNDTLEDISTNLNWTITPPAGDKSKSAVETSAEPQSSSLLNVDSETEVFDRIANKLLRSGMLLTALELHAELIERGKELPRLREYFDNPHNFEKLTDNSSNVNRQQDLNTPLAKNLPKSPSEQTFDSLDFTHYSDDDLERHGDERIAVLEFELRKAHQTISSLRASLTMSTTTGLADPFEQTDGKGDAGLSGPTMGNSLPDSNSISDRYSLRDYYCRGSGDGDSCPGEDDRISRVAPTTTTTTDNVNVFESVFAPPSQDSVSKVPFAKYSLSASIKPHEKRAINYLMNEYLMANNYKLTSITFCDENADQDFDKWDDVGLDTDRPPDLLRLYRYFWQNCSSLLRTNSNATTVVSTSTTKASDPFED